MNLKTMFSKPCIIGLVGDVNQGKSMTLYNILDKLQLKHNFDLFTYGLRLNVPNSVQIYSVAEIETIQNSIIIVDELSSLFDLDNRKVKKQIENSLRLINHNNNILVLCGTPENFKKFLSAKLNYIIYKKCTLADFINGSTIKNSLVGYKGNEKGSEVLNLAINESLVYDGHYSIQKIKYLRKYDSKKNNQSILQPIKPKK